MRSVTLSVLPKAAAALLADPRLNLSRCFARAAQLAHLRFGRQSLPIDLLRRRVRHTARAEQVLSAMDANACVPNAVDMPACRAKVTRIDIARQTTYRVMSSRRHWQGRVRYRRYTTSPR